MNKKKILIYEQEREFIEDWLLELEREETIIKRIQETLLKILERWTK